MSHRRALPSLLINFLSPRRTGARRERRPATRARVSADPAKATARGGRRQRLVAKLQRGGAKVDDRPPPARPRRADLSSLRTTLTVIEQC
jgi:hypothetical protein